MNIDFTIRLPVDAMSLPLIRGLVRQTLQHLGVATGAIDEILLALSEACANVVLHAAQRDEYQVDVSIDGEICRISVLDDGGGFDVAALSAEEPRSPLDGGRGVELMRALVDVLAFVQDDDGRHRVSLEKRLVTSPKLRLLPT